MPDQGISVLVYCKLGLFENFGKPRKETSKENRAVTCFES